MNDELYHWGILGMKWGVRRYQNPDGTLTALGRARYGKNDTDESTNTKKPDFSKMSDQELKAYNTRLRNRLNMEKEANSLYYDSAVKDTTEKGTKAITKILGNAADKSLTAAIMLMMAYGEKQLIKVIIGDELFSNIFKK